MNSVDNTNLPSETVYPPCTRCGYLSLYQADNDPGYEPPNDIHLLFVRLNFKAISWQNVARSANACSLFRYLRLESLISLEKWRKKISISGFFDNFSGEGKITQSQLQCRGRSMFSFQVGRPLHPHFVFQPKKFEWILYFFAL